jgi:hypothetical protein
MANKTETKDEDPSSLDHGANIERLEKLITGTVPVLDKNTHGWWRLAVLTMTIGATVAMVAIAYKFDPNLSRQQTTIAPEPAIKGMKRPENDCWVRDGQFVDRDGSCW